MFKCFSHSLGALLIQLTESPMFLTNDFLFFLPQSLFMYVFGTYTVTTGVSLGSNAILTAFNFHRLYLVTLLQMVRSSFLSRGGSQATVLAYNSSS